MSSGIINKAKMITIFELKNKSFCRCFIRTPFYIKNLFLLLALLAFLAMVQLVYFSNDGVYVKSITKILRGLNSDVFNYLNENREPLRMQSSLPNYQLSTLSTQYFVGECLRLSRPCKMENLAKDSRAFMNWGFQSKSSVIDNLLKTNANATTSEEI